MKKMLTAFFAVVYLTIGTYAPAQGSITIESYQKILKEQKSKKESSKSRQKVKKTAVKAIEIKVIKEEGGKDRKGR